jgi:hypothetical protein
MASTTKRILINNEYEQVWKKLRPTPSQEMDSSQQKRLRTSPHRRRVLPFLAYWTLSCHARGAAWYSSNVDLLQDEMIELVKMSMSNGKSLPIPIWLLDNQADLKHIEVIMKYGIQYRTAFAFMELAYRRLGRAILRYTGSLLPDGPLLAYQRRRRLPDRSLATLIAFSEYGHEHKDMIQSMNWKDVSILPQVALMSIRDYSGVIYKLDGSHIIKIGILHHLLYKATILRYDNDDDIERRLKDRLVRVLVPHYRYLMRYSHLEIDSMERTPMEIVAFQSNAELMQLLSSFGTTPLPSSIMHPNEIKLRQLIREKTKVTDQMDIASWSISLPWMRLNDFEIDWKSADTILQGFHSQVYKASRNTLSYAVKRIQLASTTLEKVANEITAINRWYGVGSINELHGLEATAEHVAIITPFANGGTLEDYLPTLSRKKRDILNNSNDSYLDEIHPLVSAFHSVRLSICQ